MQGNAATAVNSGQELIGPKCGSWWREPELVLVLLVGLLVHGSRLTDLSLRGEETRRALVAREMLQSGDWIVPTQQGELFLSRPPLGSWLMALTALAHGELDVFAIRLPSVLATVLTALVVYAYSRQFLSRLGGLGAGLAFLTMLEVMNLGRLGESDAVFACFLASAMLLWHIGYIRPWSPTRMWSVGYSLAAAATLTKGPQGIIFFGLATWTFLLLQKEWRQLLTWEHLFGFGLFITLYGAWQVPFLVRLGIPGIREFLTFEMSQRFEDRGIGMILEHLAVFPIHVLGSLLPWSLLLVAFVVPSIRRCTRGASALRFVGIAILVTFPFVWLPPGGRTRYYMPLFPLFAVLIGIVIDRFVEQATEKDWSKAWKRTIWSIASGAGFGAMSLIVVCLVRPVALHPMLTPPVEIALASAAALLVFCVVLVLTGTSFSQRRAAVATLAMAAIVGICFVGPFLQGRMAVSEEIEPAIADVRLKVPPIERFVSLGILHHKFAFVYPEPIPAIAWPDKEEDLPSDVEYFCFHKNDREPVKLPFNWELLAVVSCDRNQSDDPLDRVIVGRRIPTTVVLEPAPHETR